MATTRQNGAALDTEFVRGMFPNFKDGWAFFENAGGSYVPRQVIDRVHTYMQELFVQPGGVYQSSQRAMEVRNEAQTRMAELINARADEVVIGACTSSNIHNFSRAIAPFLRYGQEIIVTNLDHEANNGAWRRWETRGIVIKEWRINPETAALSIDDLKTMVSDKTRLICFPHVSNITGSVNDVAGIVKIAHSVGALAFCDGVAAAPHLAVDVKATDVDFYAFSYYKVYGPHLAAVYGKRDLLLSCDPQNHFFMGEDKLASRIVSGYPPHEIMAGLPGLADYIEAVDRHHFNDRAPSLNATAKRVFDAFSRHEEAISRPFMDFLKSKPNVRVIGRAEHASPTRMPTFAFVVKGKKSATIPPKAAENKVAIRSGCFYAYRLAVALGLDPDDGVVRASFAHYNTASDVDRLIKTLDPLI